MNAEKNILEDWHRSLVILHRAHWEAASYFEDRNFWLGLAAAAFSAVAGTTVFATLEGSPSVLVRGSVGALSVVAAILSAIQAFLRSSEVAARHKSAGVKFGQPDGRSSRRSWWGCQRERRRWKRRSRTFAADGTRRSQAWRPCQARSSSA